MAIAWEIDPVSEDAANVSLSLTTDPLRLRAEGGMDLTPPDIDPIYAASADTEGDPYVGSRYRNRTIVLSLLAKAATDALTQTAVYGLQQKVDKLHREGGTLKYTTQAGTEIVFDVAFARLKPEFTPEFYTLNKAVPLTMEFECKPYGRGTPVLLADKTETTLPVLVFTYPGSDLPGDVPGLGKLVIDEDQGVDQGWVTWGIQSQYYDSSANAALFYEAEGRTAMGGSSTAAGPSGASGAGSNVMRNTGLASSYQAILSTQATGGGAHLSHIGSFRMFVRVQTPTTNTGVVGICLEWGEGDFRRNTRNAETLFPADSYDGQWRIVDLGIVTLRKATQGTQRWEGRILAKSTVAGDDIDLDFVFLVPISEGSGQVGAVTRAETPTSFSVRDEFDQADGALSGKTLPVGGTWSGAGDATDFSVSAANDHSLIRQAASDLNVDTGRFAIAGATTFTNVLVQAKIRKASADTGTTYIGVLARYTDTSNWLMAHLAATGGTPTTAPWLLRVRKKVAGVQTTLVSITSAVIGVLDNTGSGGPSAEIRLVADTVGRYYVFLRGVLAASGQDADLATGGALATGTTGLYVATLGASPPVTALDDFFVAVPTFDAAIYASQSLEIRHDQVTREDSGGTLWLTPSTYEGDYLRVPPARKEGRSLRVIVKGSRSVPSVGPDSGIDDISARMTYTPRYLVLPN